MKKTTLFGILMLIANMTSAQTIITGEVRDSLSMQGELSDSANYDSRLLSGVTVTAMRSLVKMETDRLTYDVQADVSARNMTVLDMLRKVPMVTVDGQDNIGINGKQSIKILVDGKENPIISQNASALLKIMPASGVKKVEVITSPGAKYDAEGVGGVLNIITADNKRGQQMYSLGGNAQMGTMNQGGSLNAAFQKDRLSLSASGSVMRQQSDGTELYLAIRQRTGETFSETAMTSLSDIRNLLSTGNLQMSYEIDTLRLLTAKVSILSMNGKTDSRTNAAVDGVDIFSSTSRNKNRMMGINAGFDYQRMFRSNKDKLLTFSYLFTTNPTKTEERSCFALTGAPSVFNLSDRMTDTRLTMREHTLQLDYATPFAKHFTFDAGMKFIQRNSRSDAAFFTLQDGEYKNDAGQSLDFENEHRILAAYTELGFTKDMWKAKAGARYENTWDGLEYRNKATDDVRSDYRNLVPSAMVGYSFTPLTNIGLNYNMRVNRPAVNMLSPFVNHTDPTKLQYGNPDLDVERTHNLSLVFNHIGQVTYSLTLGYNFCDNGIGSYTFSKDGLLHETYGNIKRTQQTTLGAFAVFNITRQTKLTTFANAAYSDFRSRLLAQSNSGFSGMAMLNLDQSLPKSWRVNGSFFGMTKSYNLQGSLGGFGIVSATVGKDFWQKKMSLALTGSMPLSGRKLDLNIVSVGENYSNRMAMKIPMANVSLSATFNLGGSPQMKSTRRSIVNDDVKTVESSIDKINSVPDKQ